MKKLLAIFSSIMLSTSAAVTVVACSESLEQIGGKDDISNEITIYDNIKVLVGMEDFSHHIFQYALDNGYINNLDIRDFDLENQKGIYEFESVDESPRSGFMILRAVDVPGYFGTIQINFTVTPAEGRDFTQTIDHPLDYNVTEDVYYKNYQSFYRQIFNDVIINGDYEVPSTTFEHYKIIPFNHSDIEDKANEIVPISLKFEYFNPTDVFQYGTITVNTNVFRIEVDGEVDISDLKNPSQDEVKQLIWDNFKDYLMTNYPDDFIDNKDRYIYSKSYVEIPEFGFTATYQSLAKSTINDFEFYINYNVAKSPVEVPGDEIIVPEPIKVYGFEPDVSQINYQKIWSSAMSGLGFYGSEIPDIKKYDISTWNSAFTRSWPFPGSTVTNVALDVKIPPFDSEIAKDFTIYVDVINISNYKIGFIPLTIYSKSQFFTPQSVMNDIWESWIDSGAHGDLPEDLNLYDYNISQLENAYEGTNNKWYEYQVNGELKSGDESKDGFILSGEVKFITSALTGNQNLSDLDITENVEGELSGPEIINEANKIYKSIFEKIIASDYFNNKDSFFYGFKKEFSNWNNTKAMSEITNLLRNNTPGSDYDITIEIPYNDENIYEGSIKLTFTINWS
ncbi:lipoprotein [Spiroplasma endosymbiont of Anurida maritima]|uniref:lipoprotein n=1 Tax=Spiroplasma endosymbiont of Anurida maritima TaxID=2967972 RepID=UPI0036D282EF